MYLKNTFFVEKNKIPRPSWRLVLFAPLFFFFLILYDKMSNDGPSPTSDLPVPHAHESSDPASACGMVSGDASDSVAMSVADFVASLPETLDSPLVLPTFDIRREGAWHLIFTLLLGGKQKHLAMIEEVLFPIVPRSCVVEGCGRKASSSIFNTNTDDAYGRSACLEHLFELVMWAKSPLGHPNVFKFYARPCVACNAKTCIRDGDKMPLCIHCTLDANFGPYEVKDPLHFSDLRVAYARPRANDANAPLPVIPCGLNEMNLAQYYMFLDASAENDDGLLGYVGFASNLKLENIKWPHTTCSDEGCDCEIEFDANDAKAKITDRAHGFLLFARLVSGKIDRTNAVLYCAKHAAEYAYCGNLKKHPKCMGCDAPNVRFYENEQCLFCCAKP